MVSPPVTDEEKRAALARVLESRTFVRSEQLRAFLRYVCQEEFAGRADQLNEYALGISVFGRKSGYSPAEDSTVRSRAYDLRNKLKTYYRDEAPEDPVGIVIDKGAYVPRFEHRTALADSPAAAAEANDSAPKMASDAAASGLSSASSSTSVAFAPAPGPSEPVHHSAPPAASSPARKEPRRAVRPRLVILLAGAIVMATFAGLLWNTRARTSSTDVATRRLSDEMRLLWGPFLDGSAPVIVSFHTRLFLFAPAAELVVRDFRVNEVAEVSDSKYLAEFKARMGADTLVETYDYSDVGAVRAAFLFGRLLGADATLKDSRALDWEDLWNSNVVFVGKAGDNAAIRKILLDADLDFVDAESGTVVRNRHPKPGEAEEYENASTHGVGKKYGLVTVLPGPQPGRRLLLLTASAAELEGALAHSVTDPDRTAEIMNHVKLPSGECPSAFQVLIEVSFASNVPTNIRYVTHRVYDIRG